MAWQRAINIARAFKKNKEVDDDAMSFVCIGLRRDSNTSAVIDRVHVAGNGMPEQTPLPDLPWESRHNGVAPRPLRSVGHLSVTPVSNIDTRGTEIHVRAPQRASSVPQPPIQKKIAASISSLPSRDSCTEAKFARTPPDLSVPSSGRLPDRRLCSQRGSRIGEKSRVNFHEGNRLKLKEICAGYMFEPQSSEDEKGLELMFPTITPHTSKLNQEEANLLRLKEFRDNFTFSEDDLIEELISDIEESMRLSENNTDENAQSPDETIHRESTAEKEASTPETDTTMQAEEEVEKCPSPVPSLEFEPLLPVTNYQRRLRDETRKALLLTEARRKRTGGRE